ncbi:DUF4258 domain-containing protein [Acidobacteria bacterium AH-259-L09]|nr:DUF4258 domain-containing protein [Acidobacteria bacterium AH-259-L09]
MSTPVYTGFIKNQSWCKLYLAKLGTLIWMELYFTRHARNRMRLYEIRQEEVPEVLEHAEKVTAGAFGTSTRVETGSSWAVVACDVQR